MGHGRAHGHGSENHSSTSDGPTVESWGDRDSRIVVSQPAAGYLFDLLLRGKIDAPPDAVYSVLTDPKSHEIFRGIRATLSRDTLEDDGAGRRTLHVRHKAVTRFLCINVTFDTELLVHEDDVARTIRFSNARSDGFMRQFQGTWMVQPFCQATLDAIYRHPDALKQQQQHRWPNPASALAALQQGLDQLQRGGSRGSDRSLVTLEQALCPRAVPPGPVAHLVRGLCGRVLQNMMVDLREEVARREAASASALAVAGSSGGGAVAATDSAAVLPPSNQRSPPSLPVASLMAACCGRWGSGRGVDLIACSVPLQVTIRL